MNEHPRVEFDATCPNCDRPMANGNKFCRVSCFYEMLGLGVGSDE